MVEKSEPMPTRPDWWSQFYEPMRQFGSRIAEFFAPNSEASGTDDYYEIGVELPGVGENDIHIECHDHKLTVTGEKKAEREEKGRSYYFSERVYGSFRRSFQLPADADEDKIVATHKDGLLTIKVAKVREVAAKPKKIEISRS